MKRGFDCPVQLIWTLSLSTEYSLHHSPVFESLRFLQNILRYNPLWPAGDEDSSFSCFHKWLASLLRVRDPLCLSGCVGPHLYTTIDGVHSPTMSVVSLDSQVFLRWRMSDLNTRPCDPVVPRKSVVSDSIGYASVETRFVLNKHFWELSQSIGRSFSTLILLRLLQKYRV